MSDTVKSITTPLLINGSFRGQQVTGQQRYATEIADRLLARPGVRESSPAPLQGRSLPSKVRTALDWFGALTLTRQQRKNERLLTLTSRGPARGRGQVLVVHDLFVLDHPEWYSRAYIATHAPLLKAQLAAAELVITVSEPVADQVRALVPASTPVVTAPNAPADLFRPGLPLPDATTTHGLAAGGYVLAVASRDPRKNLDRLVAAHGALPTAVRLRFPLVLVGGSSGIFAAAETRATDSLIHLGYVDDDELARLYASAAVVAFPSLDEGFGLPAVEALAAGADVLVGDVPVLRWVCEGAAWFVDPLSVESITTGLAEALANPSTPAELSERAVAIRDRFSWADSADSVLRAVRALDAAPVRKATS